MQIDSTSFSLNIQMLAILHAVGESTQQVNNVRATAVINVVKLSTGHKFARTILFLFVFVLSTRTNTKAGRIFRGVFNDCLGGFNTCTNNPLFDSAVFLSFCFVPRFCFAGGRGCEHHFRRCALGDGCPCGLLHVSGGLHGGVPALQGRRRGRSHVPARSSSGKH